MSRKLVAAIMMGQKKVPLSDPHDSNASSSLSGGGGGSEFDHSPSGGSVACSAVHVQSAPATVSTDVEDERRFFCGPCAMYGWFMSIWMG